MLWCETGGSAERDFEELAIFACQLAALGLPARIPVRSVPEGINRNTRFDIAGLLAEGVPGNGDKVVLVAADRLTDAKLVRLRRLAGTGNAAPVAFGSFADRQAMIGARAKLSYVLGRDPDVVDLPSVPVLGAEAPMGCPVFGVPGEPGRRPRSTDRPGLLLIAPDLPDPWAARALVALALSRKHRVTVLTDGKAKRDWVAAQGAEVPIYHYGEVPPASLAALADICVVFAPLGTNYRIRSLIANLAVAGAALVDGTQVHGLARLSDAFIPGPLDLTGLGPFVETEILPNLGTIAEAVRASRAAAEAAPDGMLRHLGAGLPAAARSVRRRSGRIVFMPTNGIGLGHARRSTLIAAELDRDRRDAVFAAFPSCIGLIKGRGFDVMPLVGRSADHAQSHENDLVNIVRLKTLSEGGASLVFDGSYIFDSVFRTVVENRLTGIWIRRGLWQATQDNAVALDREKAFARVIVPSEAFDELNLTYSRGPQLHAVSPIVQRVTLEAEQRRHLRARIGERFGIDATRLIVTLLGGGVAADRSAQIQAVAGMMERRPEVLHLVVVWPTAVLAPAWFGWRRTRVVRTQNAAVLAAAADLCLSAAGYNSFHEVLYNRVPAIFLPQTGAFMDDQRARAAAAAQRELAGFVEANQVMALEREIGRFLDGGKEAEVRARLQALNLPEPGNREAARLIEEAVDGR